MYIHIIIAELLILYIRQMEVGSYWLLQMVASVAFVFKKIKINYLPFSMARV